MSDPTPEITPRDAAERSEDTLLIDVREADEWAAGDAPNATHIPLGTLTVDSVPPGASVMCVCRSGGRSAKATTKLRDAGINATNVAGGMKAWSQTALPVIRDDGEPGAVI
jgi:rhodanese-related sulfurtransferase